MEVAILNVTHKISWRRAESAVLLFVQYFIFAYSTLREGLYKDILGWGQGIESAETSKWGLILRHGPSCLFGLPICL